VISQNWSKNEKFGEARKGVTSVENKLKKNDMSDNQRIPLGPPTECTLSNNQRIPLQKKKSETLAT
jgi:hypothetical protein